MGVTVPLWLVAVVPFQPRMTVRLLAATLTTQHCSPLSWNSRMAPSSQRVPSATGMVVVVVVATLLDINAAQGESRTRFLTRWMIVLVLTVILVLLRV